MNDDQLNAALQAEYLHVQKSIEEFDSRALIIKAWSVTFSLVAIGGAFASHSKTPFLISAVSAAIFWMLETLWKLFQGAFYPRAYQIEAHFRGESKVEHPFQISAAWARGWKRKKLSDIAKITIAPHVALPHAVVMVLGAALFLLSVMGKIQP